MTERGSKSEKGVREGAYGEGGERVKGKDRKLYRQPLHSISICLEHAFMELLINLIVIRLHL